MTARFTEINYDDIEKILVNADGWISKTGATGSKAILVRVCVRFMSESNGNGNVLAFQPTPDITIPLLNERTRWGFLFSIITEAKYHKSNSVVFSVEDKADGKEQLRIVINKGDANFPKITYPYGYPRINLFLDFDF